MSGSSTHSQTERGSVTDGVELYWIPLGAGAGGALVRWSGRCYETVAATLGRRRRHPLFHSALEVCSDGVTTVIEMTPVWITRGERGVVGEGPVGSRHLRRWRLFRYEVRRWAGGSIPDLDEAIGGAVSVSREPSVARAVLDLVPRVPLATWGRDELGTGDMWNSNSVVSWLLTSIGIRLDDIHPPADGRAPGWDAGIAAARSGGGAATEPDGHRGKMGP
jgi:hypothetical protein